jgi:hypothetical protein
MRQSLLHWQRGKANVPSTKNLLKTIYRCAAFPIDDGSGFPISKQPETFNLLFSGPVT